MNNIELKFVIMSIPKKQFNLKFDSGKTKNAIIVFGKLNW